MINQASKSAIKAIEDAGGSIVCRYYNALGVRAIIKPEALSVSPLFLANLYHF